MASKMSLRPWLLAALWRATARSNPIDQVDDERGVTQLTGRWGAVTALAGSVVAALKAAGGSPKYTEYPGVGHNSWNAAYKDRNLYEWLFAQRRKK